MTNPARVVTPRRLHLLVLVALLLLTAACSDRGELFECCPPAADDWPQWRGLERDGVARGVEVAEPWPEDGPEELWRRPLGPGFSTVSVRGDDLFVSYQDEGREVLAHLDAATGEERWRAELGGAFEEEYGDGPRGAPTIHGGAVLAVGSRGTLVAVRIDDGSTLWSVDLHRTAGGGSLSRGHASSPLVVGRRVVVNSAARGGTAVLGLDLYDGGVAWKAEKGRSAASSPVAITVDGTLQVVTAYARGLVGLDPADGRRLWRFAWKTKHGLNIATPVFVPPDRVLISAGYDQGAALVRLERRDGEWSAEEVWTQRSFRNHFATSVYHDGHVYGFDNAILECLDAATGEEVWRARGYGKGSLVLAGGQLVVLSERGDLALVRATPEGHEELARTTVLDGKCWTAPSLAGGRVFLRNHEELVALRLPSGP